MEEKANSAIIGFLKFILKKSVHFMGNVIKHSVNKGWKASKSYEIGSVKKFMKRNPNAGIFERDGLEIGEYKFLKKQLNKAQQEFVTAKRKDESGKVTYSIITSKNNKEYLEYIKKQYDDKTTQAKADKVNVSHYISSPENTEKRWSYSDFEKTAVEGMERQKQERAAKQHDVHKHKEIKIDNRPLK